MVIDFLNCPLRQVLTKISKKWKSEGPWRIPSIAYTLEHKMAFLECEHEFVGNYSLRGWLHDCDKLFLYLLPWMNEKQIQSFHRRHQSHHVDYPQYKVEQLLQTYIDWECAALTKPDKPLDAFATLLHFYRDKLPLMLPVCLAINPEAVQPAIADLDEERKQKYDDYLFGVKFNKKHGQTEYSSSIFDELARNASNEETYSKTLRIITSIVQGLDETIVLMNERNIKFSRILETIPNNFSLMKPVDLFLKTLDLLAKRRKQKINLQKCVELLRRKNQIFAQQPAQKFSITSSKTEFNHNYRHIINNPLLEN